MVFSTQDVLLFTAGLIGFELLIFALLLTRRKIFHWLSAGFWAWSAFMLYYVVAPISAVISGNLVPFHIRLQLGGGVSRGFWVALVISVGIFVFFLIYMRTSLPMVDLGIRHKTPLVTPFFFYWLIVFCGFGLYSLLASRSGLTSWQGERIIESGRFVGDVTGYQSGGYGLLFFPILLLLLWPNRLSRVVGLMLAIVFIVLSLPHAWSRYVTISMLLALSMWHVTNNKNKWPNIIVLLSLVLVTLIYQARGHTQWSFSGIPQAVDESLKEVTNKGVGALAESDTQMLATFWIESAWHDDWIGHDYGLRFLNYFLTGWIPSRYMPQKYFLVDWLSAKRPPYPITFDRLLYGAKSSLIGSFYANGNIVAVVLQMALMGWFSRKVDGMVQSETPIAIRALGISWLSTLWMVWGSHDYWGLMLLGTMAIPFLIGFPVFHFKGRALSLERSTKTNYKAKVFDVRS